MWWQVHRHKTPVRVESDEEQECTSGPNARQICLRNESGVVVVDCNMAGADEDQAQALKRVFEVPKRIFIRDKDTSAAMLLFLRAQCQRNWRN